MLITEIEALHKKIEMSSDSTGLYRTGGWDYSYYSSPPALYAIPLHVHQMKTKSLNPLFKHAFYLSSELEKKLKAKTEELERLEQEMGLNNRMDSKISMFHPFYSK